MMPLLFLAYIPAIFTSVETAAPGVGNAIIRETANQEFVSQHYPPGALKRGEQGRVTFNLTIEPDGSIGACDVTGSSGFRGLDAETCDLMVSYARTKPIRNEDGRAIRATRQGHVLWTLPKGSTQVASASIAATAQKPDKLICKRTATTGSLIARTRQCLTRNEWARQEQQHRDEAERLIGKGHTNGGN